MNIHGEQFTDEGQQPDLSTVFQRQMRVTVSINGIAEQLYYTRTLWLGAGALPWAHLTDGQRHMYRKETESLVKGCGHTAQVRPSFEGRTEELRRGTSVPNSEAATGEGRY